MNRTLTIAIALIAVLGAGAYWYTTNSQKVGTTEVVRAAPAEGDIDTSMVKEMSIGNPDAAVTVIEYASFTCPHCRSFHLSVLDELKANYIDTGKINFIYREVYFDRFGLWAGVVARCGGPLRYFGISDLIYEGQSDWLADGDPAIVADNLRKIGKTAGLNDDQLDACLNDGDMAQAMVALYQQNAEADDISSTPSFVINGKKYGNMDYADFSAVLDEELAK